eukprot:356524-Chlamydomonas_euryale.AAC.1
MPPRNTPPPSHTMPFRWFSSSHAAPSPPPHNAPTQRPPSQPHHAIKVVQLLTRCAYRLAQASVTIHGVLVGAGNLRHTHVDHVARAWAGLHWIHTSCRQGAPAAGSDARHANDEKVWGS